MLFLKSFVFNPFSQNTYILYDDQQNAAIIDPGNFSEAETKQLTDFIQNEELTVKKILLTHAHIDHVLGLQTVFDLYRVPVLLHPLEQEILDRNPIDANRFGFFFKPFAGDIKEINETDTAVLGKDELKILHVPGHSPGSIAFYNENQNMLISGDVLFQGSIGRTDLYKGDHEQLISGIREKLWILPDETQVFSGHGNPTTIGFEKQYNPFF